MDTMAKSTCNSINFQLLETGEKGDHQYGDDCVIVETDGSVTYTNCDCSDPGNYDFYDEGRF